MKRLYAGILAAVFATVALADTFSLFSPSSGIMVGDPNTYVTTSATSSDVTSLWAGTCDATTYLRGDGSCAGVATGAAGSDGQIQFNNSGAFGASSGLTWNNGTSTLTATNIAGSGAAITSLNAGNLTTGTLNDARLSANVPLLSTANTFTDIQTVSSTNPRIRLYDSNAGANAKYTEFNGNSGFTINLLDDSGNNPVTAISIARTGTTVGAVTIGGVITGNGAGITNIQDAALSSNVALKNGANVFTQMQRTAVTAQEQLRLSNDNALLTFYNGANTSRSGYLWFRAANPSQIWVEANQDLQIGTNNTTRMTLAAAGNVLINSPSSGYPLYVVGDVRSHLPSASNSTFRGYDFGITGDGTSYGNIGMNMTTGEMRYRAGFGGWGGFHTFYTDGAERFWITATGSVGINAPSSGTALSITSSAAGASALDITSANSSSNATMAFTVPSVRAYQIGALADDNFLIRDISAGADRLRLSSAGSWTINAPSSGNTLTVAGIDGNTGIRYNSNSVGVALGYVTGTTAFIGTITSHQLNLLAGNASRITISSAGNVTVNTPSSGIGLTVNSSASATALSVGTTAIGSTGEIRATGDITAFYSSDARLKENIVPINNALAKIERIRGVEFDWTQDYIDNHGGEDGYFIRRHDVGVIAQEVQAVLPEVVGEREDGTLAVKYDRLVPLLIESIRELKAANDELYERIRVLEAGR